MHRLFGSKKQAPKPQPKAPPPKKQPEKKIDLSESSTKMGARVKVLEEKVGDVEKQIAVLYKKTKQSRGSSKNYNKKRLLQLMKKKKMYTNQLNQLMGQQFTLDSLAFTKENIQTTIEMGKAMKQAVTAQKDMMKDINLDELEDLKDDMEEMQYESEEINEMMNMDFGCDIDEDELDEELAELDDECFLESLEQGQQQKNQPSYLQDMEQPQVDQNI